MIVDWAIHCPIPMNGITPQSQAAKEGGSNECCVGAALLGDLANHDLDY